MVRMMEETAGREIGLFCDIHYTIIPHESISPEVEEKARDIYPSKSNHNVSNTNDIFSYTTFSDKARHST